VDADEFDQWLVSGELGNAVILECPYTNCFWEHPEPFVSTSVSRLRVLAEQHVREEHS
jgi:hypothetical protein